MRETAVIIDLDKTVFPTWPFIEDVAQALENGFGIDAKAFNNQVDGLHIKGVDNLRYYDFFAHVQSLGLDADEVEAYVLETFNDRDYVYEDVEAFVNFLATEARPDLALLLTYGEHRIQRLKYGCAPSLGRLACIDTLEPKGQYIRKHFAGYHGIVIDDKPIAALPKGFRGVLLDRGVQTASGPYAYNSLSDVQRRWSEISPCSPGDSEAPP